MKLTNTERAYTEKRRKLLALWPWLGGAMLLLLLAFLSWLWISTPLMINPWAAIEAIDAGTLPETTLTIMAAMLPIIMGACVLLLFVMVAIMYAAFSKERKLLAIVDRLSDLDS